MAIGNQIDEMLSLADRAEVRDPAISNWSVGQQIEHCCLSMRGAAAALHRNRDEPSRSKLTLVGRLVVSTGRIPRGRGKAPAAVVVDEQPSEETIRRSLEKARSAVESLDPNSQAGYFEHGVFGTLDPARTARFLEIHNAHHLAIIRDILSSATQT